jgi:hypothetical protein
MAAPCPLSRRVPQDVWEAILRFKPRDRDMFSPTAALIKPIPLRWLSEPVSVGDEPPRELFVRGSTLARDNWNAAEDAHLTWRELFGTLRPEWYRRGLKHLERASDIAFYHLELFEEWRADVERDDRACAWLEMEARERIDHSDYDADYPC